jgi:hypothetical protein
MKGTITFFPAAPNTNQALSILLNAMTENLDSPEVTPTAGDIVPLFAAVLELAGKLEKRLSMLDQRMAVYEAAAVSRKSAKRSGPTRRERIGR